MRRDIEELMIKVEEVCKKFEKAAPPNDKGETLEKFLKAKTELRQSIQSYADQRVKEALEEVVGIVDGMEKPINISDPIHIQEWAHGYHQALTDLTTTLRQKIDDISTPPPQDTDKK